MTAEDVSNSDRNQQDATNQEAPRIEFPCSYPIKVIGLAVDGFQEDVLSKLQTHAGEIAAEQIDAQYSKNRNYLSVRVTITATGEDQLQALFTDLKTLPSVKMVL